MNPKTESALAIYRPSVNEVSLTSGGNIPSLSPSLLAFWVITVIAIALTGCGDKAEIQAPPAAKVKIAHPLSRDVTEWDEFTGRIEAIEAVEVRARVGGHLEKVNFFAGENVKKGDLLFTIDPKPYQAQLNLAQAELERAKSKRELAQNDLERAENLLKAKAISIEEYDGRSKGLREASASVQAAEANVYRAKLDLEYTRIHAPIDGRVGRELITAGNLVNGGGAATLLTHIVSIDPVYVYIDADERSVLKYKRQLSGRENLQGMPMRLNLTDESDFPHRGTLDYIAPSADTDTGTVTLRGVFENTHNLLSPGFFARVRIQGGAPYPALLLPDRAIGTDQAQRFVWVLNQDDQAEYRKVIPGARIDGLRVISEGLTAEDKVVIEGQQKVRPGAKVAPELVTFGGE